MGVIAVWKCDRDGAMFSNKKDAEEHDKMLELAASISSLIEQHVPNLDDVQSEEIGLLLAKRRAQLVKACKGKPEALLEEPDEKESSAAQVGNNEFDTNTKGTDGTNSNPDNVTSLAASQ